MSSTTIATKITAISDLIRLRRQYGTALVLLPTLWGLFMASGGRPTAHHLLVFVAGSFLMRSAGCAINDIADRRFDALVERTRSRPLAEGRLRVGEALVVFAALSLAAFLLALTLNRLTIALAFVGILLASLYPFVKRASFFPQPFLGAAFGWGAVMAWSAVHATIALPAILIFIANIFYATAYDTMYALMDVEDDVKAGVKSTAVFFAGRVYAVLDILYTLMAAALLAAGLAMNGALGPVYYAAVAVSYVACLAITRGLKKNPAGENAFRGFLLNAWVGALILVAIIIDMNLVRQLSP